MTNTIKRLMSVFNCSTKT